MSALWQIDESKHQGETGDGLQIPLVRVGCTKPHEGLWLGGKRTALVSVVKQMNTVVLGRPKIIICSVEISLGSSRSHTGSEQGTHMTTFR